MRAMLYRSLFICVTAMSVLLTSSTTDQVMQDNAAGRRLPALTQALALSQHYVEVTFEQTVDATTESVSLYSIVDSSGQALNVTAARMHGTNTILLTTATQQNVEYQLELKTKSDQENDDNGSSSDVVSFTGSTQLEPTVDSAVALDANRVLVAFSEAMDATSSTNIAFYTIVDEAGNADSDLTVISATLDTDPSVVILQTSDQGDRTYRVVVRDVAARRDNVLVNPLANAASFGGISPSDTLAPRVAGAVATSQNSVLVSFSEALAAGGVSSRNFSITDGLAINAVSVIRHRTQALLTTSTQVPDREYTVTVTQVNDPSGNVIDPDANAVQFIGTGRGFFMQSAVALSNTSVLITFNEPPDPMMGLDPSFYSIVETDDDMQGIIRLTDVIVDPIDPRSVILTTTAQDNVNYTISANNLHALRDDLLIDGTRDSATFLGIASRDTQGPRLLSATSTSSTSVVLAFSEPLNDAAAVATNISISCPSCESPTLLVLDAFLSAYNTRMILTTPPQLANVDYIVLVENKNGWLTDLADIGNPIDPDPSSTIFTFLGQPSVQPGFALPRVVGAISTSNTTVVVSYNKPMGDSALESSNYVVAQVNVNAEVGTIALLGGTRFLGLDRTSVELTTSSQNEVTYEISVVNVKDLAGNQLAPKELLIDPASAQFPGTPPGGSMIDSDGDGVSDSEELRGYVVNIQLTGGEIVFREVTSDPFNRDTDSDGLDDLGERVRFSNPRSSDTDFDAVSDFDEVFKWGTSLTNQDTDGDGVRDSSELGFFKTSPLFADTDGDGMEDGDEVIRQNRDPRIADLPDPGIDIGQVALRLDTRFAFTDTQGESKSVAKSSTTTLAQNESRTFSTSDASTTQHAIQASAEFGAEFSVTPKKSFKASVGYTYTRENTFTASQSSTRESQQQYQDSLTTNVARDVTQAVTRTIEGASIEVLVTINNGGDIPFTMTNIQLTALLQDPFNRRSFVPVATMLPGSLLDGGGDFEVFLGPFIPERGPFIFKSTEVFPSLVEDLMKTPRGLIFKVANFDIEDEEGRNFAFVTQDVNDRTAGMIMDYGNGEVDRFRVSTHSQFDMNECSGASANPGAFCRSDGDCTGGQCLLSDARPVGVSMKFILQDILGMTKNGPVDAITIGDNGCGETWAVGDDVQVASPICFPVPLNGLIVDAGPNGILDSEPSGDDIRFGNTIIDGGDGCAHTRASRDDVQIVQGDCQQASPDGVMVTPGPDGIFQTNPNGDDVVDAVTGYETQFTGSCDGNTDVFIDAGINDAIDSIPGGDDEFVNNQIQPGANGILETSPRKDDIFQGPGIDCDVDVDCPGAGLCKSVERLVRIKGVRNNSADARFWLILSENDIPQDTNFDDIRVQASDTFSLAYVQDRDADGLLAREEFIFGSSDRRVNSDGCPLGDGEPGCDVNVFDFDTVRDFEEVKEGWTVAVAGERSFTAFSNPVQPDTDSDKLFDDEEQKFGTDHGKRDTDGDGISDYDEINGYDILRRDDELIRKVVPYQSAIIGPGSDNDLETLVVLDANLNPLDIVGTDPNGRPIITAGPDGVLDTRPDGNDTLEETMLILDGGNGTPESIALLDDIQVGPSPISTTTVTVTYLDYDAGSNACDGLQDGEFNIDLRVRRNTNLIGSPFTQSASISRFIPHALGGMIIAGANGIADTEVNLSSDDIQVVQAGDPVSSSTVVIRPGPNGVLETTPDAKDVLVGNANGSNRMTFSMDPNDSLSISGSIREDDAVCDINTRRAIIESGELVIEPWSGGNGIADTVVPVSVAGLPLNDDVQEVAPGAPVLPGQVVISAGLNGILETTAASGDIAPVGNGIADTLATGNDAQVIPLGNATSTGSLIVSCGPDGEPDMNMNPTVPGVCEAVVIRTETGDGTADTLADPTSDDIQVVAVGSPVIAGDVIVRAGPNGVIDSPIAGTSEQIQSARAPLACAAVIVQSASGSGVAHTTVDPNADDIQLIAVGMPVSAGAIIIDPGPDNVIDSIPADFIITEPSSGGNGKANTTVLAGSDDVQVVALNDTVSPGQLIIAPGPDGILQTAQAGDDVTQTGSDVLIPAVMPDNGQCATCALGECFIDEIITCGLCPTGSCVGDDALLVRGGGDLCEDGLCPCGSCLRNQIFEEWSLSPINMELAEIVQAAGDDGVFITSFENGPNCFSSAKLTVMIEVVLGVKVDPGAVLIRPGPNGVLDTEPRGDDIVGAPHLSLFATDPLNRDTDEDTLFDGAEMILGSNPNDPLDASKFRDNDLDGLVNVEETDGWFIGFNDVNGLKCRTEDGSFILVDDEFNPPAACEFVFPDRFEPDSDFDGLPDLLERLIRSDPTSDDTDGDGLLDYDEFDLESTFSIDLRTVREFERKCFDADRCIFVPFDQPYGTSVVLADTDQDGRTDREEIFESWIILPCDALTGEQVPKEVFSSPLSSDADRDGVPDGLELSQGTDPNDPDTDGDGKVDNPNVDLQPDGCGIIVTVSFLEYRVTDDCDPAGGDGEFSFSFSVNTPVGGFPFSARNNDLDDNRTNVFASNQATFLLRPGETFSITGVVRESDNGRDEVWYIGARVYSFEGLKTSPPPVPLGIGPRPGEPNDECYDGHSLQVSITSQGA